jgi:hypothetical protein
MMLLIVVLSTVVIDAARTAITGSAGGIEEDVKFAKVTQVGAEQFAIRWSNLMNTVYILVGGQLGNFIILTLGLYWLFQANFRESSNFFIMIFLSIGLVPFLLGDFKIQTRVFYDIPFQIPAAIALCSLWKNTISRIIVPPACIWLIIVAIISVSNFYINAVFR